MNRTQQRRRRMPVDAIGWLLATTIVVLTVLDLLIWATLWNVPNPISELLMPEPALGMPAADLLFQADAPGPTPAPATAMKRR